VSFTFAITVLSSLLKLPTPQKTNTTTIRPKRALTIHDWAFLPNEIKHCYSEGGSDVPRVHVAWAILF
jgi:hypothetical protein